LQLASIAGWPWLSKGGRKQRVRVTFVETEWHGRETGHSNSLVIHRFDAHPEADIPDKMTR